MRLIGKPSRRLQLASDEGLFVNGGAAGGEQLRGAMRRESAGRAFVSFHKRDFTCQDIMSYR